MTSSKVTLYSRVGRQHVSQQIRRGSRGWALGRAPTPGAEFRHSKYTILNGIEALVHHWAPTPGRNPVSAPADLHCSWMSMVLTFNFRGYELITSQIIFKRVKNRPLPESNQISTKYQHKISQQQDKTEIPTVRRPPPPSHPNPSQTKLNNLKQQKQTKQTKIRICICLLSRGTLPC